MVWAPSWLNLKCLKSLVCGPRSLFPSSIWPYTLFVSVTKMNVFSRFLIWATLLLHPTLGQSNTSASVIDPDLYPGASQSCLSALSTSGINCNPLVYSLYTNYYTSLQLDEVTDLCKDACYTGLEEHSATVSSACQGVQYYDEPSGSYYPANILDLQALSAFNQTCFKNKCVLPMIALFRNLDLHILVVNSARHIFKIPQPKVHAIIVGSNSSKNS